MEALSFNSITKLAILLVLLRMWNLEQNDNYVLQLEGTGFESGEVVNCIAYNKAKGKAANYV